MVNHNTAMAIPVAVPEHMRERGIVAEYVVMVGHAGRSDRTGAKVHIARLTVWANGDKVIGSCNCSGNGHLRGSLVTGRDFSAVSCKRCGCSEDAAERRNAKAIVLPG